MSSRQARFLLRPTASIGGELVVPGDKSISHRALMLGAVANGHTTVRGFLDSEDCLATLAAFTAMGVAIRRHDDGRVEIDGNGIGGLTVPPCPLDLGNSGTAMRLLAGLLAGARLECELTGDASLRARPMERVAEPLKLMGAEISTRDGKAPIRIGRGDVLHGIDYRLPVASAQIKSALLLAGLSARGTTTVRSPGPTRDHTERMLTAMGVELQQDPQAHRVALTGPAELRGTEIDVPGDFSSAAFFLVAACLGAERGLLIRNVGINPTRTGLLTILQSMGAAIEVREPRRLGGEPVADLYAAKSRLRGVQVPVELVPLAIDEFPALFVAAAGAEGRTVVRGAAELRHKESDRLSGMANALRAVGANVEEQADGLSIDGGRLRGGRVDSLGDHRIAMALSVASLISADEIEIGDTGPVATSFPNFAALAADTGFQIEVRSGDHGG